jgi:copper chaperone
VKKQLFLSGLILALVIFLSAGAFAGEGCGYNKTSTEKAEQATVHKASATTEKATMTMEEMAKACGMSVEECKAMCGGDMTHCGLTQISVKGMTCGACEKAVKQALVGVDGVRHVVKVDHKEGMALVCTEKGKTSEEALTTAISSKGYQAQVMPAVARSTDDTKASTMKAAAKGCTPGCAAAKTCAMSKAKKTSSDAGSGSK